MNECLIIRISNQLNVNSSWWIWSESHHKMLDKGDIDFNEELGSLAELAEGRNVYVLLSGADVNLQRLELPTAKLRQLDKALPYLLEDRLADEVEALYFAQLSKQGKIVYAAVMEKEWFAGLMNRFKKWGIKLTNIIPEVLAIPDDGQQHGLKVNGEWLIRKSSWIGTTIPESWLPFYLPESSGGQTESDEGTASVVLHSSSDMILDGNSSVQYQLCDEYAMLSAGVISARCSLLTGEFKPHSSGRKYWNIWKKCVYALLALLVIWGVKVGFETTQINNQVTALHQESERIFREIFPGKQRIPTNSYLKRQFSNELAALSGGAQGTTVLTIFENIAQALANKHNIEMQSFSYDAARTEVKVDFKGNDFSAFEEIRIALEQSFTVQQGPLNKSNDQVFGSYILTEK